MVSKNFKALAKSICISAVFFSIPAKAEFGEPAEFGKNRTLRFSGHP